MIALVSRLGYVGERTWKTVVPGLEGFKGHEQLNEFDSENK